VGSKSRARTERSAGGVVLRQIGGDAHFLLIRDPYHNWGLPKGHLKGKEGPDDAALREVQEETGLADLRLGPDLGSIDWHFRAKGRLIHKFCRFFLMASTSGDPVPELDEGITECRWLPVEKAIQTVTYENARGVLEIAARLLADGSGRPSFSE